MTALFALALVVATPAALRLFEERSANQVRGLTVIKQELQFVQLLRAS